ncbi:lipopolysaccharide-induced tumor necrosis factor-alpha factor homolog isoform X3 [Dreissena polymorpha]|uniref:lipopolysaccharide-induced tumor necrosis factor-alpha factor homolog isoform X3 n=1 Tax=Dreissena polymorpha TaxID=45954 RepID=UPI00226447AC|nr:lipopolysaccharide-induced tumor necrosis factor-alpha factor homolog isoform X3 [Dreissena polymorpha]
MYLISLNIPNERVLRYELYDGGPSTIFRITSKQQTIYVQGPPIIIQIFRDTPVRIQCQYCQAEVFTATHHENGAVTWLACLGIMLVLPLGCCLIPFFIDGTKDVVHTCPNCYQEVGKWSRL